MKNKKSDVKAKNAFVTFLKDRGFSASVVSKPADIVASKNGQTWYFEIKMTKRTDNYFGAATLTEWKQAIADPEHFRFVVAKTNEDESAFDFLEFTPDEFMQFSTIPPFKIFFNIDFDHSRPQKRQYGPRSAVKLSRENLEVLSDCFERIKGSK